MSSSSESSSSESGSSSFSGSSSSEKEELTISKYSHKWLVLRGDADLYHRQLQRIGCRWTTNLRDGPGYLFEEKHFNDVRELLKNELLSTTILNHEDSQRSVDSSSESSERHEEVVRKNQFKSFLHNLHLTLAKVDSKFNIVNTRLTTVEVNNEHLIDTLVLKDKDVNDCVKVLNEYNTFFGRSSAVLVLWHILLFCFFFCRT